jgi:hypothetical protein
VAGRVPSREFTMVDPPQSRCRCGPEGVCRCVCGMAAGLLVFHDQVSRALGADVLSPEGHLRMSKAIVDFCSHTLLSPELATKAHAAYDQLLFRSRDAA